MDTQKVVAQVPWPNVMRLISKLIRYSKGGIDKSEAADLAEELLMLASHLIENKNA